MERVSSGGSTAEGSIGRRAFLAGGLAGLSVAGALGPPRVLANTGHATKDVSCIFIWTQGGTSHHDTFDPKPQASDGIRGPLSAISTAVPGVFFTELCGRMARELGRYTLLRSWNPRNAGHGGALGHPPGSANGRGALGRTVRSPG